MKPTYADTVEVMGELYQVYKEESWFTGIRIVMAEDEYVIELRGKPLPKDLKHPFIFNKEIEGEELDFWVYPEEIGPAKFLKEA